MIKQLAWNTFIKTGNIDTFLEFTQLKEMEEQMSGEKNGNNQDKRDYITRKQF